jgi:diadenosine tetraphosphatase ApaH/serine/threonine PP2A family protein phosphatase
MRIAVLSDIHGNLIAFEAALAHARAQKPDLMVIAGDMIIGAPDSGACWRLARSLGCPVLRGNNERYAFDFGTERADGAWATERFGTMREARGQLSGEDLKEMAALPLRYEPGKEEGLVIVHASLRSDCDSVTAFTAEAELERMFPGFSEGMVVRGHNHMGQVRHWGENRLIVTASSVGIALDGEPTANYLLLDKTAGGWRFSHQSVAYDLGRVWARYQETDYLKRCGPMGRLFVREVMTGTHHVMPFMRAWRRWEAAGDKRSLGERVAAFLDEY